MIIRTLNAYKHILFLNKKGVSPTINFIYNLFNYQNVKCKLIFIIYTCNLFSLSKIAGMPENGCTLGGNWKYRWIVLASGWIPDDRFNNFKHKVQEHFNNCKNIFDIENILQTLKAI